MESEIENKNKNGKDSGPIPEKKSIQKTMIRNIHYSIVFRVIIQFIPCISKAMKLYVFFFQE